MGLAEHFFSNGSISSQGNGLRGIVSRFLSPKKAQQPVLIKIKSDRTAPDSTLSTIPGSLHAHHSNSRKHDGIDVNNTGLDVPVEMLRATAELSDDEFGLELDNDFGKEAIDSSLGPDDPKASSSTNRPLKKPSADALQHSVSHPSKAPGPVILSEFDDLNPVSGVPPRLAASFSRQRSTRPLLQILQRIVIKPSHVVRGGLIVVMAGLAFILYASLSEQRDRPEPRYPVPAAMLPNIVQQAEQNSRPSENIAAHANAAGSGDISIAGAVRPTPPHAASIPEKTPEPIQKAAEASPAQNLQANVPHQSHAAVAQPPESIEYLLYTGSACEQRREFAGALTCYKKAAAFQPSEYRLQNKVGSLLLSLGLYADAQPYLARALALNEDYTPALINMGIVHAKLDNYDAAERYLLRALALDGTNTDALHNMMLVCRKKGLYSLAATYAAKLNALGSTPQK